MIPYDIDRCSLWIFPRPWRSAGLDDLPQAADRFHRCSSRSGSARGGECHGGLRRLVAAAGGGWL